MIKLCPQCTTTDQFKALLIAKICCPNCCYSVEHNLVPGNSSLANFSLQYLKSIEIAPEDKLWFSKELTDLAKELLKQFQEEAEADPEVRFLAGMRESIK